MALDPNIILRAGEYKGPDVADTLERRAQIGIRNATLARAERQEQEAAARTVRLGSIGAQAASGDYAGARTAALSSGDFDLADAVSKLDDGAKKRLHEKVSVAAPVFATALAEPDVEKRGQIIAAALPTLQSYGYTPEEIAKIQPSDEFLRGAVANAQTVDQVLTGQRDDRKYGLDREKFAYDKEHDAAQLGVTRAGNYLSAGLLPPEDGGGPVPVAGGGGGAAVTGGGAPVAGRTQYGWTPRARNGGDNTDEAVDAKIAGMSKALGVDPTAPLTNLSPVQIAQALALSEGGKGSIADRNNNPGNLRDPKTGAYRRFPTKDAGIQAAAAQVRRNLARGQTTIQTMVEGLPVSGGSRGGGAARGGLAIIPGGKLDPKADKAPSGYRFTASGDLEAIPGGPGDKNADTVKLKAPPAKALTDFQDNLTQLRTLRQVAALYDPKNNSPAAKRARASIGPTTGALGERFTQWNDPEGTEPRAAIGRIGGIIIKDTSGAAVSVSEDARLSKWVPLPTDTPQAVNAKLRNLANAIEGTQQAFADIYNEDNGYRPLKVRGGTLKAPTGSGSGGPRPGTVQDGYRFKGGNPASPQSWEKVK